MTKLSINQLNRSYDRGAAYHEYVLSGGFRRAVMIRKGRAAEGSRGERLILGKRSKRRLTVAFAESYLNSKNYVFQCL